MAHPSKRKGTQYERELEAAFHAAGLRARRAYGSNGCTLTTDDGRQCAAGVDLVVQGRLKVQAKRRASIAAYVKPPPGAHVSVLRGDHGESLAVIPLPLFLKMLSKVYD